MVINQGKYTRKIKLYMKEFKIPEAEPDKQVIEDDEPWDGQIEGDDVVNPYQR